MITSDDSNFQVGNHSLDHVSKENFNDLEKSNCRKAWRFQSNEYKFFCDQCDYRTNRKYSLKYHQMIHSDLKPFQCSYCNYRTCRKFNLVRHQTRNCKKAPSAESDFFKYENDLISNVQTTIWNPKIEKNPNIENHKFISNSLFINNNESGLPVMIENQPFYYADQKHKLNEKQSALHHIVKNGYEFPNGTPVLSHNFTNYGQIFFFKHEYPYHEQENMQYKMLLHDGEHNTNISTNAQATAENFFAANNNVNTQYISRHQDCDSETGSKFIVANANNSIQNVATSSFEHISEANDSFHLKIENVKSLIEEYKPSDYLKIEDIKNLTEECKPDHLKIENGESLIEECKSSDNKYSYSNSQRQLLLWNILFRSNEFDNKVSLLNANNITAKKQYHLSADEYKTNRIDDDTTNPADDIKNQIEDTTLKPETNSTLNSETDGNVKNEKDFKFTPNGKKRQTLLKEYFIPNSISTHKAGLIDTDGMIFKKPLFSIKHGAKINSSLAKSSNTLFLKSPSKSPIKNPIKSRTNSNVLKKYKCSNCNFRTYRRFNLVRHQTKNCRLKELCAKLKFESISHKEPLNDEKIMDPVELTESVKTSLNAVDVKVEGSFCQKCKCKSKRNQNLICYAFACKCEPTHSAESPKITLKQEECKIETPEQRKSKDDILIQEQQYCDDNSLAKNEPRSEIMEEFCESSLVKIYTLMPQHDKVPAIQSHKSSAPASEKSKAEDLSPELCKSIHLKSKQYNSNEFIPENKNCNSTFNSCNYNLTNNELNTMNISDVFQCLNCSYKACNKYELFYHINYCHFKKSIQDTDYDGQTVQSNDLPLIKQNADSNFKSQLIKNNCNGSLLDNNFSIKKEELDCSKCIFDDETEQNIINHVVDNSPEVNNQLTSMTDTSLPKLRYYCKWCDYETEKYEDLLCHTKLIHKTDLNQTLPLNFDNTLFEKEISYFNYSNSCSDIQNQYSKMRNPINYQPKLLYCMECGYKTCRRFNLIRHERKHTRVKPFHCSKCDFQASRKENLICHELTHIKRLLSTVQNISFLDQSDNIDNCELNGIVDLIPEYEWEEENFDNIAEQNEDSVFDYEETLEPAYNVMEENVHQEDTALIYICSHCDFITNSAQNLVKHEKKFTGKIFECEVCEYKTCVLFSLNHHKEKHTTETLLQCNICEFKCRFTVGLINHRMNHFREQSFFCNIMKDIIDEFKNYKFECDLCDYRTDFKQCLVFHEMEHTQEITFCCISCSFHAYTKLEYIEHQDYHCKV